MIKERSRRELEEALHAALAALPMEERSIEQARRKLTPSGSGCNSGVPQLLLRAGNYDRTSLLVASIATQIPAFSGYRVAMLVETKMG